MGLGFTAENIDIPFGKGITIGFTDDRYVFMVADSKGADGKPFQSTFLWQPDKAVGIAEKLKEAADRAVSKIILPRG